jgi:hypothetical protein
MRHPYLCDMCGCFLDPGEGRMCEECREKVKMRASRVKQMQEAVRLLEADMHEISVEEAV